jgi:pyruvate,water dikinase
MLINIEDIILSEKVGNKAKHLMMMMKNGFRVPNGFVLDSDTFGEIISYNKKEKQIRDAISGMSKDNIKKTSTALTVLFDNFELPQAVIDDISERIKENKNYAVRSSGLKEDLESFSFAGQYSTFLNTTGIENIKKAIIDCYKSMYTETILTYFVNNNIAVENLEIAVIVQEMVNSDASGIAFTVNPLTGEDKEIVVEIAEGLGENIVSGKVNPERYFFNWFKNKYIYQKTNKLLSKQSLNDLMATLLDIQLFFGYPCDIEFAIENDQLYILQSRAITKIMYTKIKDQWSTADFKDGGVSATVCTPYMWSLYEYIWENTLKKYMVDSKILKPNELRKLGDMFYGRPYWNMSIVKKGMAMVPGYKEREFDSGFGVKITYTGDGNTTKITPKSIYRIIRMAIEQKEILSTQLDNVDVYKKDLLNKYNTYIEDDIQKYPFSEFQQVWYNLIKNDYLQSEGTYFWQIFLNTIHQSLFKDKLLKYVSKSEFFNLIGGLDNISHLLPFYDMWAIGRKIIKDKETFTYWNSTSIENIKEDYVNKSTANFIPEFTIFMDTYGYHSEKELDVTYPCYFEDVNSIIKMLKENILLDESCSPVFDKQKQKQAYNDQLAKINSIVSEKKYDKLVKSIEKMRSMLWWREELRDISTRFYYVIRIYTCRLANMYVEQGIINDPEDIWFLKFKDIFDFIDQKKSQTDLAEIIAKNRQYYNSFRNFTSENEIGAVFNKDSVVSKTASANITGIGCNSGVVTGTARIIENLSEIDKLQMDDILITKFTDTGWTSKFAILKGIVTEYGGILCHAAIVSREYGIPCVVCVSGATKQIKDGSTISVNGETGEIVIIKE